MTLTIWRAGGFCRIPRYSCSLTDSYRSFFFRCERERLTTDISTAGPIRPSCRTSKCVLQCAGVFRHSFPLLPLPRSHCQQLRNVHSPLFTFVLLELVVSFTLSHFFSSSSSPYLVTASRRKRLIDRYSLD